MAQNLHFQWPFSYILSWPFTKKLSQMAHTISEVKMMTCIKCKGERIVWTKDKYGHAKAKPCPLCNREGNNVRNELKTLKK